MNSDHAQRLGLTRPQVSRGLLPLVLGAMGVAKGIVGAVQANQSKQRNKGFINANYRLASQRLDTNQANTRQSTAESLNARGLSPVAGAMMSGNTTATNLGEQTQGLEEKQFGLERQDLDNQHNQALSQNNAEYTGALVNSGVNAVTGAMEGYNAGQDLNALHKANAMTVPSTPQSPVASAMMSGGPSPDVSQAHFGVDPINPFSNPASAWHPSNKSTLDGAGIGNADFNVGNA